VQIHGGTTTMMVAKSKLPTRRKTRRRKKSSQKLQPSNSIVVTKGKLKVANFETADHEIVNYFGALPKSSRPEKFVNALRTGAGAFSAAESTERTDYVEKKFENMHRQFSEVMQKTIQGIEAKHEEVYGENGKFREIIDANFGVDGSKLTTLLDPNREGSPLQQLKNEIGTRLFSMEKGLGIKEKEDEIIDKTALKGQDVFPELRKEDGSKEKWKGQMKLEDGYEFDCFQTTSDEEPELFIVKHFGDEEITIDKIQELYDKVEEAVKDEKVKKKIEHSDTMDISRIICVGKNYNPKFFKSDKQLESMMDELEFDEGIDLILDSDGKYSVIWIDYE